MRGSFTRMAVRRVRKLLAWLFAVGVLALLGAGAYYVWTLTGGAP